VPLCTRNSANAPAADLLRSVGFQLRSSRGRRAGYQSAEFDHTKPSGLVTARKIDTACLCIIRRYQQFNERNAVISGFGFAKARVEIEYGEIDTWALEHKGTVAKAILKAARDVYSNVPHSAFGIALMGLYLEAQTIPGDKAARLVDLIEEWHRRAAS